MSAMAVGEERPSVVLVRSLTPPRHDRLPSSFSLGGAGTRVAWVALRLTCPRRGVRAASPGRLPLWVVDSAPTPTF